MTFPQRIATINLYGQLVYVDDTSGMLAPMRCRVCEHLHDSAKVTVIGRYADCSTWHCPNCKALIDDRPRSWGGSAL